MSEFKAVVKGYISQDYMRDNVKQWTRKEAKRLHKVAKEPRFGNQLAIELRNKGFVRVA